MLFIENAYRDKSTRSLIHLAGLKSYYVPSLDPHSVRPHYAPTKCPPSLPFPHEGDHLTLLKELRDPHRLRGPETPAEAGGETGA